MSSEAEPAPSDAEAIAAAVVAHPAVVRLLGGSLSSQVATYLPGRRVEGVRITDEEVEVHVCCVWGARIPDVAQQLRAVIRPLAPGRSIQISVDDLDEPAPALQQGPDRPPALEAPVPRAAIEAGDPPTAVPSPS